jgi:hypothetical protein
MLFTPIKRTDPRPIQPGETVFEFLDRVNQPYWERLRSVLNDWFTNYPNDADDVAEARRSLTGSLRSKDPVQHSAAVWELFLHEHFKRAGFLVTVEPTLANGKRPDFLLSRADQRVAYVEAAVDNPSHSKNISDGYLDTFYDTFERNCKHKGYIVSYHVESRGDDVIAGTKQFCGQVNALEPDPTNPTHSTFVDGQWKVEVTLYPDKNVVGLRRMAVGEVGVQSYTDARDKPVRNRLKKKGEKLKGVDLPLVVAINVQGHMSPIDPADVNQTLLGSSICYIHRNNTQTMKVKRDGALHGPNGPQLRSVSGLLFAQSFAPEFMGFNTPTLYRNPHAHHPIDPTALQFPCRNLNANDTWEEPPETFAGVDLLNHFGLRTDWPGPESLFSNPY